MAGFLTFTLLVALVLQTEPPVIIDEVGTKYSIEADSIKSDGKERTAWVRQVYATPKNPGEASSRSLWVFRCETGAFTMRSLIFSDIHGMPTKRYGDDQPMPWLPLIPGTPSEAISREVCSD